MTSDRFKFSAHIGGWLFEELGYEDRAAAAAEHGFSAVEDPAAWRYPAEFWRNVKAETGLGLSQFGLRAGNRAAGEKGIAALPDRRSEFREALSDGLAFVDATGCRLIHVMSGVIPPDERTPAHDDCLAENLALAAREAGRIGAQVIIEPMCDEAVPGYVIRTPQDALTIVEAAGNPGIGLLLDVFHTAAEGLDPAETIRTLGSRIAHVHFSDRPGRHEPGSGRSDFSAIRSALEDINYRGFLGCEYTPVTDTRSGLGWMREFSK